MVAYQTGVSTEAVSVERDAITNNASRQYPPINFRYSSTLGAMSQINIRYVLVRLKVHTSDEDGTSSVVGLASSRYSSCLSIHVVNMSSTVKDGSLSE